MRSSAASPAVHAEPPRISINIGSAGHSWELLMQSGARVPCTVGIPLKTLLNNEFCLTAEQRGRIDVMLLDGKPVDDPETAIVPDGARLALAAGLPGIAGLSMKSGSALRALRPGITFKEIRTGTPAPKPGAVELALFSLALDMLAGSFLARGVVLRAEQFARYARLAGNSDRCSFCGQECSVAEALAELSGRPADTPVFLVVKPSGAYSQK